jgi:hypothetical protein
MPYQMKPLSCDPARIKGMSERLIVSHYENNYGGAVKRLNLIQEKLAELDYANAAGFLINGLKREELIAMNSMILHGCSCLGHRGTASSSTNGHRITATRWSVARPSSRSTCTNIPITSTLAPRPPATSIRS